MTQAATHIDHEHHLAHWLMLGGALLAGTVILSPYILPVLGIGTAFMAEEALEGVCATTEGTGIAAGVNNLLKATPVIGSAIAGGGYSTAIATGVIGIGGTALGKKLEQKHTGDGINWGKTIKNASLVSSMLIALPSLLTGISMGLSFTARAFGGIEAAENMDNFLIPTLGGIGKTAASNSGLGGGMALIPHLITCGGAFLPAATGYFMAHPEDEYDTPQNIPANIQNLNTVRQAQLQPKPLIRSETTSNGIRMGITSEVPQVGQPCQAFLTLQHADGSPLSTEDIAVTHTQRVHLMLIDSSMQDYQHLHPQPTEQAGVYTFTYTPRTTNPVQAWADFTLEKDGTNPHIPLIAPSQFTDIPQPPTIIHNARAQTDDLHFQWVANAPLRQGEGSMVTLRVTDPSGNPITQLEPIMGAYCHLVGFTPDGKDFIHSHPLGEEPTSSQHRGGPDLQFHVQSDNAGDVQFYAQVKFRGQEYVVPFGQTVEPARGMMQTTPDHKISHAAMQHKMLHNHGTHTQIAR